MDSSSRIARSSLHIEVADRVRDMIFDHSLPPGFRIDELQLSARLGTSRTPLREALKVLANEGMVRLAPGRGAYVTELSVQEVDALFPVLAMLEARCAAEAVRRQTPSDVRRLNAIHQKMEAHVAAGDADAYYKAADSLHHMLHKMAANPWLLRATSDLRRFLRLVRAMTAGQPDTRLLQSLAEHRTLLKTVARGDAQSAEQVMHHHLLAQQRAWRTGMLNRQREAAENTEAGGASEAAGSTEADGASERPGSREPAVQAATEDAPADQPAGVLTATATDSAPNAVNGNVGASRAVTSLI